MVNAVAKLREIAKRIDTAQHCADAADLYEIARNLERDADELLLEAKACDSFFTGPVCDRATKLGRLQGAACSLISALTGFRKSEKAVA